MSPAETPAGAPNRARAFLLLASLFAGLGVALGAFGAHGLKRILEPRLLEVFNTGVLYQLLHALALLGVALWIGLAPEPPRRTLRLAAWSWALGIVLFSGSLYIYTLSGVHALAFVTPFGGAFFILGWALLFLAALRLPRTEA